MNYQEPITVVFQITSTDIACGIVQDGRQCPAARAITVALGNLGYERFRVEVHGSYVYLLLLDNGAEKSKSYYASLPLPLQRFVLLFDLQGQDPDMLLEIVHHPFTLVFLPAVRKVSEDRETGDITTPTVD